MGKKTNGGMVSKLIFHKCSDIISVDSFDGINANISLAPNAIPIIVNCVSQKSSFESNENEIDSEEYSSNVVKCILSDINGFNNSIKKKLKNDDWICIFESLTRYKRILGNKFTPCKISFNERISEDLSFNGYDIIVTYNSKDIVLNLS